MRRFEFEEGKSHKFWEIAVEGNAFTVRYGKVGTEGQTQTKTFKDAAKAEAEADKKIAEKTGKGYVEVAVAGGSAAKPAAKDALRNDELEQAIFDAPEDPQAWSVYADWLQGQGDPWGERITLGIAHAAAKGAEKSKLKKAIDKLEEAHREHFFGKTLAKLMDNEDFEPVGKLEWQYGMIVGIRVAAPEFEWSGTKPDGILRAVVKSPAGRFLRSVRLGLVENDGEGNVGKGIDALAKSGTLKAMRDLFVGDFEYPDESEISWVEIGDVDKLLTVMPDLRSLRVRGGYIGLGKALEHAKLESLLIETGGLPSPAVKAIGKCRLPELKRMEVWFGQKNYGGDGNIKMLEPLFTGEGLPKLEHLGLMNAEFTDDIAIGLARSPLLARLKSVDLSMGTLRDAGGQAILDAIDSFAHLEHLDLNHHYMSETVIKALRKALGKRVDVGGVQSPHNWGDGDRFYTQVGE
jgi:uncharacterized protein (TIGR02996 family)